MTNGEQVRFEPHKWCPIYCLNGLFCTNILDKTNYKGYTPLEYQLCLWKYYSVFPSRDHWAHIHQVKVLHGHWGTNGYTTICSPMSMQYFYLHFHEIGLVSSFGPNYSFIASRADSRFVPSQWEMALVCNNVSHWLGASLESALCFPDQDSDIMNICLIHQESLMHDCYVI